MELIERGGVLSLLGSTFESISSGEGHCILISGEAGIGKTSLVKAFCRELKNDSHIYQGTCDALFTPRPLAPLYDIALQMHSSHLQPGSDIDRVSLFTNFFQELSKHTKPIVLIVEDIHWADEATLDFIKFLGRRITRIPCLLILTYRDNEIHAKHPLRNVFGQLPPDTFTRMPLTPLSIEAVEKL